MRSKKWGRLALAASRAETRLKKIIYDAFEK
jgi:hypothetical protein